MTVTSAKSPDVEKFWLGIKMYYLSLKAIEYNAFASVANNKKQYLHIKETQAVFVEKCGVRSFLCIRAERCECSREALEKGKQ